MIESKEDNCIGCLFKDECDLFDEQKNICPCHLCLIKMICIKMIRMRMKLKN